MKDIIFTYKSDINNQKILYLDKIIKLLAESGYNIIYCQTIKESLQTLKHNARIVTYLFDWETSELKEVEDILKINPDIPVFAICSGQSELNLELSEVAIKLDFLQFDQHLIANSKQRIIQAIDKYLENITPPFTKELMNYVADGKYTFCTPGHMGGTAFTHSPVGSIFYDFFGENTFKADISISVPELGSLLDHSGLHKVAEEFIAETFNSDYSYIVTNGTSTANKMVGMFSAGEGDTILVDRNCHKSICHFMMMTDVVPIYLRPTRNAYGILGGIPKHEFLETSIKQKISNSSIPASWPTYAVVTNSTYDGLLYNTEFIKDNLVVKHLHFDSAWVPYTAFHPIYKGKYGMSSPARADQVIFETQSTHKLLAAFSQASMVHIKGKIDKEVMDECFMMHTSTSPLYQITASCEISAAMMKGPRGLHLINSAIKRAAKFRMEVKRLKASSSNWYYDVWQPDDADYHNPQCFELEPEATWHGFKNQDAAHMYLDPVKVTVLLPGIENNRITDFGIPAEIVAMYLDRQGIIVEKTGPYTMLFLFSIGIDSSKSMNLLSILNSFKADFDNNLLVRDMLPELYQQHPDFYSKLRIQELAHKIHKLMQDSALDQMMYKAFDSLPTVEMTPHKAFQKLVKGQARSIKMRDLQGHTSAVMVLPYPPGVPLIMPGEKITQESRAVLDYLILLEDIGDMVPGFGTDIHGVETDENGNLLIKVLD